MKDGIETRFEQVKNPKKIEIPIVYQHHLDSVICPDRQSGDCFIWAAY